MNCVLLIKNLKSVGVSGKSIGWFQHRVYGMNIEFLDRLKRERDISIKAM